MDIYFCKMQDLHSRYVGEGKKKKKIMKMIFGNLSGKK